MNTYGIIGAMDLEIALIKDQIKNLTETKIAGFTYYGGTVFDKNIVLVSCGVGKVNAACCTQILIDRFKIDYILHTGIAGGLHRDVKVCDVVISTNVTHHDVRKDQMIRLFPFKEYYEADKNLIELAVNACEAIPNRQWNYHLGRIVSGEAFVSDNIKKNNIVETYSPHCVEMEGSAIGHVSYLNNIPFVIIRSISDNADDDAEVSYDNFETLAAINSSTIVLNMLEAIDPKVQS